MTTFATANFGRAKSAAPVRASMDAVEHALAKMGDVVLCAQEINEGDVGYDDRAIMDAIFAGWTNVFVDSTRDPILVLGNRGSGSKFGGTRAGRAVKHQSPPRWVNRAILPADVPGNADTAVLNVHYPAGYLNGHRSPAAYVLLKASWLQTYRVHRRTIREHHKAGRNVVTCFDGNAHKMPRLARGQVVVYHHGPDYIIALPAKGRRVEAGDVGSVHMSIESKHDAHYAEIHFPKES